MSVNTKINGQLVKSAGLYKNIVPIGMGDIYSTEERQIGVWKDGRPLYQKSFVLTTSLTVSHETFTNTGFSIPNVDAIRYGEAYRVGNLGLIACDFNVTSSNTIGIRNSTLYDISFGVDSVITIQYTKSTDTAGSGIWTPSGSYAEHFSTDEQVIGTWTDGKPIYRITLPEVSFGTTDVTYTHNLGIKQYINVYGSCTINGTNYPKSFPFYQHKWNHFCEINNFYENDISFSSDWNNNKATVTLEYTKIADYT